MRLVIRLPLHPEYRPRENLNDSGLDIEVEETPLTQFLKLSGENDLDKTLYSTLHNNEFYNEFFTIFQLRMTFFIKRHCLRKRFD